ncbi:zinc finger protein AEBP2 [Nothoprocta perdicaria]|nr:zinc finger protein AEBP2 [Nothoprocta perdicaria]
MDTVTFGWAAWPSQELHGPGWPCVGSCAYLWWLRHLLKPGATPKAKRALLGGSRDQPDPEGWFPSSPPGRELQAGALQSCCLRCIERKLRKVFGQSAVDCSSATSGGRRGSLEMSSDGEPLSRMDSEDSISSTIMDVDSTISSGRSTPVMMNGQGAPTSSTKSIAYNCCWDHCHACFSSSPDLADHIRSIHVDGQRGGVFVCLWKGCKVYNTPSTSQSWLQRHMLTHSGDKPFKCVVGGCNASFASQGGLARHVPTHFSQQNSSKVASQPKAKEESPSKAGMNKRRKLKNKRRRSLPRPHDFFDAQTLDAIRHRAICFNLSAHIESLGKGHSVVFHSTVIAKRKEDSGKIKLLLHWTPEDILPDVWVNESERHQLKTKVVHLSKLPKDTALLLDPNIYRTMPQKRLKRLCYPKCTLRISKFTSTSSFLTLLEILGGLISNTSLCLSHPRARWGGWVHGERR